MHYSEGNTLELQVEGQPPIRFQPKAIPEITEAIATVGLTTTMQRSVKFQRSRSADEAEPFPVITIVVIVAAVVVLVAVILVVIGIVQYKRSRDRTDSEETEVAKFETIIEMNDPSKFQTKPDYSGEQSTGKQSTGEQTHDASAAPRSEVDVGEEEKEKASSDAAPVTAGPGSDATSGNSDEDGGPSDEDGGSGGSASECSTFGDRND